MWKYKYKLINNYGDVEIGYCSKEHLQDFKKNLKRDHKVLLYVRPTILVHIRRLRSKEWTHLFYNFYLLLRAGLPLIDALQAYQTMTTLSFVKQAFRDLCTDIKRGQSFSSALQASPLRFPPVALQIIILAESTGNLISGIETIHRHLSWQAEIKDSLKKSLRYPAFLSLICLGLFYFLNAHVAPQMIDFLKTIKGAHSEIESFIHISYMLEITAISLMGALFIIGVFYILAPLSRISLALRDKWLYQLPIIALSVQARFFQTFSICMHSHIDLIKALELSAYTTRNVYFQQQCEHIKEGLHAGLSLQEAFACSRLFSDIILSLMRIGDITGYVEKISEQIAQFLEQSLKDNIDRMTRYMEPTFILLLGGFLLFIVLHLFYPLYEHLSVLT